MVNRNVIFTKTGDVVTRESRELLARWIASSSMHGGYIVSTAKEGIYGEHGIIYAHMDSRKEAFEAWAIATDGVITLVKEHTDDGNTDLNANA